MKRNTTTTTWIMYLDYSTKSYTHTKWRSLRRLRSIRGQLIFELFLMFVSEIDSHEFIV